jgi:hypothetical protein
MHNLLRKGGEHECSEFAAELYPDVKKYVDISVIGAGESISLRRIIALSIFNLSAL